MKRKAIAGIMMITLLAFSAGCGKDSGSKQKESSAPASESQSPQVLPDSSGSQASQESPESQAPSGTEPEKISTVPNPAVFLGIKDYSSMNKDMKDNFRYRFFMNGEEKLFTISNDTEYRIQNLLKEGYVYSLELEGETVRDAKELTKDLAKKDGVVFGSYEEVSAGINDIKNIYHINRKAGGCKVNEEMYLDDSYCIGILNEDGSVKEMFCMPYPSAYEPPVKAVPGEKTLKNLIATALMPAGCVNYVYGGGWDWQDAGSSVQCKSIGVADSWKDFFFSNAGKYTYKPDYYPNGGWNEYYYAGLDCSGYIGWVIYNINNTADGEEGYVMGSTKMAGNFAERGWGNAVTSFKASDFKPGDIFSLKGHVWMCIGTCPDGSIVIAHSTPSKSRLGKEGGGVQLSALGTSKDCEAYKLADRYMSEFYPSWYSGYEAVLKNYADYTAVSGGATGKFSWKLDGGLLTDPDGLAGMSAAEVLRTIYGS